MRLNLRNVVDVVAHNCGIAFCEIYEGFNHCLNLKKLLISIMITLVSNFQDYLQELLLYIVSLKTMSL